MKKFKITFLLLWFAVILFLMTASFTNLIFNEDRKTVYNITFVLDDDQKPQYDLLKKGIEQARQGTGVKLYYLNLYDNTDKEDIVTQLKEQLAQKDMVIVKCDSTPLLSAAVQECSQPQKLICIQAGETVPAACCNIHTDERNRGLSLAQRIGKDQGNDCTVYVFGSAYEKAEQDTCIGGLQEGGLPVVHCLERSEEDLKKRLEEICAANEAAAVVGMQPEMVKRIVQLTEAAGTDAGAVPVYGFGFDSEVLQYLEEGRIKAVNVTSDYYAGYAGVYSAWLALEGEQVERNLELGSKTVGRDEMFLEEYAEVLFAGE